MPWGAVVFLVTAWLFISGLIAFFLSEIKPKDRHLTKPKWVRISMMVGGPLTGLCLFVFGIILALVMLGQSVVEALKD